MEQTGSGPTELAKGDTNAVGRMLGLLGDEWTLLVVQQALLGATRFAEFKTRLPISNSVLTRRLQSLTRDGLLDRRVYQTNPTRAEYLATPRSHSRAHRNADVRFTATVSFQRFSDRSATGTGSVRRENNVHVPTPRELP